MHAYWYAARNGFRQATAYRWDFLQSGLFALLFFAVQALLWSAALRSSGAGRVAGFTAADLQAYLLVAAFLWPVMGRGRVDATVARSVREGELSVYITRPLSHAGYRLAVFAGERLAWGVAYLLPVALLGGVAGALRALGLSGVAPWLRGPATGPALLGFLAAVTVGLLVVFLLEYSLGLLAFWSGEITAWTFIKNVVANVAAGTAFPLEVLPAPALAVVARLPFRFLVHVPAQAYAGRLTGAALAAALAEGLAWAGALALAAAVGWRAGLRRFTAAGG